MKLTDVRWDGLGIVIVKRRSSGHQKGIRMTIVCVSVSVRLSSANDDSTV